MVTWWIVVFSAQCTVEQDMKAICIALLQYSSRIIYCRQAKVEGLGGMGGGGGGGGGGHHCLTQHNVPNYITRMS